MKIPSERPYFERSKPLSNNGPRTPTRTETAAQRVFTNWPNLGSVGHRAAPGRVRFTREQLLYLKNSPLVNPAPMDLDPVE
ncbi:MAG: hypothetical protein JSS32_09540 [Verrucomicrobia bacterium]|nr:hypothetical protein [Verrucomicrobiota bacterium]